MTWVQIQKASEMDWAAYERVSSMLGDDAPPGLIYHAAGEQADGRWQSVSIWESEEDFNRFRDERLMPAARAALGDAVVDAGPPPTEAFEAKHTIAP